MNKKLLCSTALAGALISGAAFAELKIGGDITHTINVGSNEAAANATNAGERLGTEMNLNLASKADLNNGMYISYKGKLEVDDTQSGAYDHEYEIQLGQGNFYIGAGSDAGNNISSSPTLPVVGYQVGSLANNVGPYTPLNYDGFLGLSAAGSSGNSSEANNTSHLSLNYKAIGGTFSYIYSPNNSASGETDDDQAGLNSAGGGSAYAVIYQGSPVANVKFIVARNVSSGDTDSTAGTEFTNDKLGVSYNFGKFAAGVEYQTQENDNKATDDNALNYAVSMKASDSLTLGLQYSVAEADGTSDAAKPKEKIKAITAGYNLGAASIAVSLIDGQDIANGQGQDVQGAVVTTKFKF
jgi:hypothetical protein